MPCLSWCCLPSRPQGISSGPAALLAFSFFTALSISAFDGGSTLTFKVRCAGGMSAGFMSMFFVSR